MSAIAIDVLTEFETTITVKRRKGSVSKETEVSHRWGSDIRKFRIKWVWNGQITTVRSFNMKLTFQGLKKLNHNSRQRSICLLQSELRTKDLRALFMNYLARLSKCSDDDCHSRLEKLMRRRAQLPIVWKFDFLHSSTSNHSFLFWEKKEANMTWSSITRHVRIIWQEFRELVRRIQFVNALKNI